MRLLSPPRTGSGGISQFSDRRNPSRGSDVRSACAGAALSDKNTAQKREPPEALRCRPSPAGLGEGKVLPPPAEDFRKTFLNTKTLA